MTFYVAEMSILTLRCVLASRGDCLHKLHPFGIYLIQVAKSIASSMKNIAISHGFSAIFGPVEEKNKPDATMEFMFEMVDQFSCEIRAVFLTLNKTMGPFRREIPSTSGDRLDLYYPEDTHFMEAEKMRFTGLVLRDI